MKTILIFCCIFVSAYGRTGFGPGEQDWGFVNVRDDANMFWWLYYTTAKVEHFTKRPLIIWLQGGPGGSSTGFGNFEEFGPLDTNLQSRNYTWVKDANVLFIDNPVGTGFSYVGSNKFLTKDNKEIADDLLSFMIKFYEQIPEFKTVPLYIVAESYGGKMTVDFALALDKAIKNGKIECNLVGVGLGDSWISPIDSVLTWAPYLYNTGVVSREGMDYIQKGANLTRELLAKGRYAEATDEWSNTEMRVMQVTNYVDFYNILTKISAFGRLFRLAKPGGKMTRENTNYIMNVLVRKALDIDEYWKESGNDVFTALSGDFMKPVTDSVELLLNTTDVKVFVFNGQLDLIVDTPGTMHWVERLKWSNSRDWKDVEREAVVVNNIIEGYVKRSGNFAMYWVNRAGHMVPADNPAAMSAILKDLTNNYSVS